MRKLARHIAKVNMKEQGMVKICKHGRGSKHTSYFAQHWREYV